jgi:hypothetical protein
MWWNWNKKERGRHMHSHDKLPLSQMYSVVLKMKYIDKVKKRIKKDEFGGVFTSYQIIEDCGFVDFLFIGSYKDKEVVWNATLTTARGDYYEEVFLKAQDEGYEKFPTPYDISFEDYFVKTDNPKYSEFRSPVPELDDKRHRWISERTLQLLNEKSISIKAWNIEIDESYEYGVGLHARVDIPTINVDDVFDFIKKFNNMGPTMFDDNDDVICMNANELGVELKPDNKFISWTEPFSPNTVALSDKFLEENPYEIDEL